MSQQTKYRDNGAIGALLDEYERSIADLIEVLRDVPNHQLSIIVDHETKDEDCRSIQTIMTHVVGSGYGYAHYIRSHQGDTSERYRPNHSDTSAEYIDALRAMFLDTVNVFQAYPSLALEESDQDKKIHVSWGQYYNVEQMMEHAIVHILRHRRQIERFLLKFHD